MKVKNMELSDRSSTIHHDKIRVNLQIWRSKQSLEQGWNTTTCEKL